MKDLRTSGGDLTTQSRVISIGREQGGIAFPVPGGGSSPGELLLAGKRKGKATYVSMPSLAGPGTAARGEWSVRLSNGPLQLCFGSLTALAGPVDSRGGQ